MLACNCLNVIIESETNDFQKVTADSLNLSDEERKDNFFKQELQQVGKLIKINKTHLELIKTRTVGSWIVYQCINCSVHSHAVHRDKGAACVLVASKLLNTEAIMKLRNSDMYSTIFNIIVNSDQVVFEDIKQIDNYTSTDVEVTIKGVKKLVSDVVKREVIATEERIRKFTEEQYQKFENFRERAFREQAALTRVILSNSIRKPDFNSSTNKEISIQKSEYKPSAESVPIDLKHPKSPVNKTVHKVLSNTSFSNKRLSKTTRASTQTNSLDAEGLFEFDGIDEVRTSSYSEIEESDTEEVSMKDESFNNSQRNKDDLPSLAKSLPMTIPAFMSFHNHVNEDKDDSFVRPEDPLDIAASIKALAKSVHGDTVFGDLPRPRFSTQI